MVTKDFTKLPGLYSDFSKHFFGYITHVYYNHVRSSDSSLSAHNVGL